MVPTQSQSVPPTRTSFHSSILLKYAGGDLSAYFCYGTEPSFQVSPTLRVSNPTQWDRHTSYNAHTTLMTLLLLPICPTSAEVSHFSFLFLPIFKGLFLFYVYACITCMHVCPPATCLVSLEPEESTGAPGSATWLALGTKPESSGRATSAEAKPSFQPR